MQIADGAAAWYMPGDRAQTWGSHQDSLVGSNIACLS